MTTQFKVGQVVSFKDADDAGNTGSRRGELYKIEQAPDDGIGVHFARHADGTHIGVYGHRFEAVTDFQAGDEVQVVKSGAHRFWYSDKIGQTFKLNSDSRRMSDGMNYGTEDNGDMVAGCDIILVNRSTSGKAETQARVPGPGDKVRVVKSNNSAWWYARRIGDVFTLTGSPVTLGDGINYRVTEHGLGLLALCDVELVIDDVQPDQQKEATMDFTNIENRTIAQIKAKLDELNTTLTSAQAEIKGVEAERDDLLAQLKAVGIIISGIGYPVGKTMREAYNSGLIYAGDTLRALVSQGNYTKDADYRVRRVDSDGSVLVDDDNSSSDYIWQEHAEGEQFLHIPA